MRKSMHGALAFVSLLGPLTAVHGQCTPNFCDSVLGLECVDSGPYSFTNANTGVPTPYCTPSSSPLMATCPEVSITNIAECNAMCTSGSVGGGSFATSTTNGGMTNSICRCVSQNLGICAGTGTTSDTPPPTPAENIPTCNDEGVSDFATCVGACSALGFPDGGEFININNEELCCGCPPNAAGNVVCGVSACLDDLTSPSSSPSSSPSWAVRTSTTTPGVLLAGSLLVVAASLTMTLF